MDLIYLTGPAVQEKEKLLLGYPAKKQLFFQKQTVYT